MLDLIFTASVGFLSSVAFLTLMWYWGKSRDNYAVIDVGWGLVVFVIAIVFSLMGDGHLHQKLVLTGLAGVWGLRLAGYLYWTRIRTNHPEDKRYTEFRKGYGDKVHQKMFTNVFLLQAVLAFLLTTPFFLASYNSDPEISSVTLLGVAVFFMGLLGETISDQQLSSFVKNPANKGKVCEVGLWKYSRHPNYFFEWVIWLGISVAGSTAPFGNFSYFSCIFIYVLLRYVSGVPMAEKFSLQSKGELYRDYQRRVSAFFPFFPRK